MMQLICQNRSLNQIYGSTKFDGINIIIRIKTNKINIVCNLICLLLILVLKLNSGHLVHGTKWVVMFSTRSIFIRLDKTGLRDELLMLHWRFIDVFNIFLYLKMKDLAVFLIVVGNIALSKSSISLTKQKTFGHSIKNGRYWN